MAHKVPAMLYCTLLACEITVLFLMRSRWVRQTGMVLLSIRFAVCELAVTVLRLLLICWLWSDTTLRHATALAVIMVMFEALKPFRDLQYTQWGGMLFRKDALLLSSWITVWAGEIAAVAFLAAY